MKKLRLLFNSEPRVDGILLRALTESEYRVCPKVRLGDVVGKEDGEYLPERVFRYLTTAHLDFLILKDGVSLFAVEFDGAHHLTDRDTVERDILKNRICCAAELPLLRITGGDIIERDRLTLLDYMMSRAVAWPKELPSIMAEIESFSDSLPADYDEEDLAVDLDPMFHFNLHHPYPLVPALRRELRDVHKMIHDCDPARFEEPHDFLYDVQHLGGPHPRHLELRESVAQLTLWGSSSTRQNALIRMSASVAMKWALSLGDKPPPNMTGPATESSNALSEEFAAAGIPVRFNFPWTPRIPGFDPHGIGDTYAEYLVLRKLKAWALDQARTHV